MTEKISFENTRRLIDRGVKVRNILLESARDEQAGRNLFEYAPFDKIKDEQKHRLNRFIFDEAERQNISVYDICLNFMPNFHTPIITKIKDPESVTIEQTISLIPLPLEFEKGPGYWKGKYYRLKQKLQGIIDNKDD